MALARSASGPGGLSINTSSANSLFGSGSTPAAGGMFGSTQTSKPGGLFGASTTSAPQTGGLFGTTTTQPQTGGLFGSTTAASQPQTGGLFGSTAATTQLQTGGLFGSAQPQQGGGLFGNTAASQPAQSGGLFGSSTTASQPQQTGGLFSGLAGQQNQPTGGGLFGASTTQPAQSGGLFSGLNNQNQNQNKPATSLFGSLGSTTQNQQQPQQAQPQQPSAMFSTLNNQNQSQGLFGNTLTGGLSLGQSGNQQQQQQQQSVPGVRIDLSNIRGTTRFNDLHEDLQKEISNLDAVIQSQIRLKNDCDAIMPAHDNQLAQVPNDVEFCRRKLIGVENSLDSDAEAISLVQKLIKTDAENANLSIKAINVLKLPPQYHTSGMWSANSTSNDNRGQANGEEEAQDIVSFFTKTADELSSTLSSYQRHIVEIEQHLRGVEASSAQQINALVAKRNGGSGGEEDPMEQLAGALRDFEQSLLGVAGKVGGAREGVQSLQLGRFSGPTNGQRNGLRNGHRNGVY